MLSIGKMVAGAEDYYLGMVAEGREEYYTGSGEAPGTWIGSGIGALGSGREVDPETTCGPSSPGSRPRTDHRSARPRRTGSAGWPAST